MPTFTGIRTERQLICGGNMKKEKLAEECYKMLQRFRKEAIKREKKKKKEKWAIVFTEKEYERIKNILE